MTSDSSQTTPMTREEALAVLAWYRDSGVDTAEALAPTDFMALDAAAFSLSRPRPSRSVPQTLAPPAPPKPAPLGPDELAIIPHDEALAEAKARAAAAPSIAALAEAIAQFDGCALKGGARSTVVYDGVAGADLLVLGEAPGREEDRTGKPFVGKAGGLLDKMLASIGYSRQSGDELADACITNTIYWRPPGNRNPTKAEIAICQPFVERFILLTQPKAIMLTGNVPTQAFFEDAPGITRSRGKWRTLEIGGQAFPALPMFHPAFLLRQPLQKRLAWADLLAVKDKLR